MDRDIEQWFGVGRLTVAQGSRLKPLGQASMPFHRRPVHGPLRRWLLVVPPRRRESKAFVQEIDAASTPGKEGSHLPQAQVHGVACLLASRRLRLVRRDQLGVGWLPGIMPFDECGQLAKIESRPRGGQKTEQQRHHESLIERRVDRIAFQALEHAVERRQRRIAESALNLFV